MGNLFSCYLRSEDFRILVCCQTYDTAQELCKGYALDSKMADDDWEIIELDIATAFNHLHFDCDYVVTK